MTNYHTLVHSSNTRWMLKKWRSIERVEVRDLTFEEKVNHPHRDCRLIVYMRGDKYFTQLWSDRTLLLDFLDRPVLQGVALLWFGAESICGGFRYRSHLRIEDYDWRNVERVKLT